MSEDAQVPADDGIATGTDNGTGASREATRYEVTVHVEQAPPGPEAVARISALDLDRIPDPDGVRLLVTMDDAARLVDQGFEVRLLSAVGVRPLPANFIPSDDEVREWFDDRVRGVTPRTPEPGGGVGGGVGGSVDDTVDDEGGER